MKYDKKKNISLILATTPIKSPPGGTKVLRSLFSPSLKEGKCSDTWKFIARHCENGRSNIQGIDFDQSYSPVAHDDYFITKISIAAMHRILVARILDVSNEL